MPHRTFVSPEECSHYDIFPGVQIRTAGSEKMTLSLVTFEPHAVVQKHAHPHEQIGMVVQGSAKFIVGDEEKLLGPGEMYFIPGEVEHQVIAGADGCQALDVFHPVREDYR